MLVKGAPGIEDGVQLVGYTLEKYDSEYVTIFLTLGLWGLDFCELIWSIK